MSKPNRHQSVVSKYSDSQSDEDNWISKLESSLIKDAVQPRQNDDYLFNQINNIMNGTKSKYKSVEDAVEDMKARSGYSSHLSNMNKVSKEDNGKTKLASDENSAQKKSLPIVIMKCPQIKNTLENFIRDTRGNISIPAIIEKIKNIHQKDVSDAKDWEDDNFIKLVSRLNLQAKQQNPVNYETHSNLGTVDHSNSEDIDPSNTDAFHALTPSSI